MLPFSYSKAVDEQAALHAYRASTKYVAGGTNLLDLMKLHVETPEHVIDITGLPLGDITLLGEGVRIGALVRNSALAYHPLIVARYPMLSQALLAGASPQLRNMATVGGNLLQRTRCLYFRDTTYPCNKRHPGSGCTALTSENRGHAVLGGSDQCVAVMPSDLCVALAALDAVVQIKGSDGERAVPLVDFHLLPGDHPERETVLAPGELITAVDLPALPFATHSLYRKMRDRASYAFALVSVAAALDTEDGIIKAARLALGGVGTKPWRAWEAEAALVGQPANEASYRAAAEVALRDARPLQHNGFKIEMAKRAMTRALVTLGALP
ncbi:MAG: xanthine dehydrogenase family protein subunit M [Ktedonobacteraceae bacterium]|nr:xanthine dehydrogenase family protein subunit M [Ktedonobacteraceae bacterium]